MPGETLMKELSSIHEELQFFTNKYKPTRIGFAVLLKFFHLEHKFPNKKSTVPKNMMYFIAKQLDIPFNS